MSKQDNLHDFVKDLADDIRERKGTTDLINPQDFKAEYGALIDSGGSSGGHEIEDGLITRTLTSYSNDRVEKVGIYAFYENTIIESVSFLNATLLDKSCFFGCTKLKSINMPKATTLNYNCLKKCGIESLDLPLMVSILLNYIDECPSLKTIKLSVAKTLSGVCTKNTALTDIYLGYNGLVTLSSASAFASTITGLKIHVRSAYAEQYATATNWVTLIESGQIVIVGDYIDD